jgi:hypothetical protein
MNKKIPATAGIYTLSNQESPHKPYLQSITNISIINTKPAEAGLITYIPEEKLIF